MDIIHRNIERLIYLEDPNEREAIEPMSEWTTLLNSTRLWTRPMDSQWFAGL